MCPVFTVIEAKFTDFSTIDLLELYDSPLKGDEKALLFYNYELSESRDDILVIAST